MNALPPPSLMAAVGSSDAEDFIAVGREFRWYLEALAGLRPDERVLEIGSGCGRLALALADYLEATGSYDGIDVSGDAVRWCQENITPAHANLAFQHADVYNGMYNAGGSIPGVSYVLPFDDAAFDVIVLPSVFTHMLPGDVEHYLLEMARVLAPGGRALITYFLLNDRSRGLIEAGASQVGFQLRDEMHGIANQDILEGTVAYTERYVWLLHARCGLPIQPPIMYGRWSGWSEGLSFQDIVLAVPAGSYEGWERESAPRSTLGVPVDVARHSESLDAWRSAEGVRLEQRVQNALREVLGHAPHVRRGP